MQIKPPQVQWKSKIALTRTELLAQVQNPFLAVLNRLNQEKDIRNVRNMERGRFLV